MRLLVTGASGELGSYLVPELLKDGHHVTALVHRALPKQEGIDILRGDVTLPWFGTETPFPPLDGIVHCAGIVSFRDSPELRLTNVVSVERAAHLSVQLGVPLFHVSTAYVCGKIWGIFGPRDLDVLQTHRNAYERSKFAAECIIRGTPGLKYTVIRPSILVDDFRVRGIPPISGFYVGIRGLYLGKRWVERKMGLPGIEPHLRLRGDPEATLNLMPVDTAARQIADIVKADIRGTFFVTNEHPPTLHEVAAAASGVLGARIEMVPDFLPNPAERLVARLLRDITPYMMGEPHFDNSTTRLLTKDRSQALAPVFLEATIRRLLGEAKNVSGPG